MHAATNIFSSAHSYSCSRSGLRSFAFPSQRCIGARQNLFLIIYRSEWARVELLSVYKKNKNSMWSYGALMVKWYGCVRCLGASDGLFLSLLKMWGRWDLWAKLYECEPLFAVRRGELFIWFIVVEFWCYEANLYVALVPILTDSNQYTQNSHCRWSTLCIQKHIGNKSGYK